jgi:hydrophobe/amphiphile efflux-1 (HAE1) family protein
MSISEVSIRRPVFAWMLMVGLILFGAICFQRMGISQMPDVDFPVVNISLRLDNAAPGVMEVDVVDIIEDAVMGIEGLQRVTSNVSQGIANVTCEFTMKHNINVALQEVEDRIQQSSNLLPTLLYPPVITKTNPEDQPILWVMVTVDAHVPLYQQMIYSRNTLKDQLSTIAGVGNVTFAGYVEPNLRVWVDRKKLYKYDLTSTDIINAITAEQIEQPAGRIESAKNETNIRILGEARNVEDFGKIRINTRNGGANYNPIALSQVARIEEGISDLRQISRFNGKTAVGLGIVKQHGSNAVEVARLISQKVKQLQTSMLPGFHVDVQLDTTQYIRDSVDELNMSLVFSALLTSIVCFLFLGSWSSTINVFLAIPTSIVGAFSALYFFGFTLNTFTFLGLSLAIGIVVDDAIMMLENIVRHYEMGKNRRQAAIDGSNEITFAALATTMAIAAIFIPVIFMEGVVGRFFYQYGITVTVAVFLSLLEALTLTPMRCARFLHSGKMHNSGWILKTMDAFMEKLSHRYHNSLEWSLKHRALVILFSLGMFAASMFLLSTLRKELIPPQDQSLFLLSIKTPVGSSIYATDLVYKKAEEYLKTLPEIKDLYTTVGNYENNNVVNAGLIYVILKDPKLRKQNQREVMDHAKLGLRSQLPNTEIMTQDLSLTGFSASRGFPVEFTLEGPEWQRLLEYSKEISKKLEATGLLEDINTDFQVGMPEVQVIPDRTRAAQRGVSVSTMGQEVSNLIGGQIFNANTQYPKDDHRYYIRVRSELDQCSSVQDLRSILLSNDRGTSGTLVPLPDTSTLVMTTGPQLVSRVNRARAIPVYANVANNRSQKDALDAVVRVGKEVLPANSGYYLKPTGSAQAFTDAFSGLIFALSLGIAVAYMVLASQFNSFIHPITVLTALPFSLSGALIALYLCHQSLSLYSMIGLILLMGIVKKNSILLVDFTNQRRAEGLEPTKALLEACPVRLRPILMTSVATIAGAIPEALNFGAGAETRVPMAISIIGGVLLSTVLTLYVVPCVYSAFTRFESPETEDEA